MNYGRYEVIKEVGRGAMGVVYQARDPHIDRLVAVKVLRHDRVENEAFVRRFMKEAKVIGRLSHPHIVTIYDVGEEEGNIYIAMEFLEGRSLADVIRERRPEAKEVTEFGIQIAETLDYAHRKGVVHRDIKPSNIIVQSDGGIKITDFGIARIEDSSATLQTQTGEILGTPAYMSPEQVLGNPVDGRSDIFSLGVILYEMGTGRRPFGAEGKTLGTVFNDIIQITPAEPAAASPVIQKDLSGCIMKTLEKDPAKRFQSGSELANALRGCLAGKEEVAVSLPPTGGVKRGRAIPIAVAVVMAAAVGGVFSLYRDNGKTTSHSSSPPPDTHFNKGKVPPAPQQETVRIPPVPSGEINQTTVETPKRMPLAEVKNQSRRHKEEVADEKQKLKLPSGQSQPLSKLSSLMVRTTPQGAGIYIDGKLKGRAPLTLMLPKGEHLIRAVHPGYQAMEKEVFLEETMEYPLVFNLKAMAESDDWVIKPLVDRPKQ